MIDATTVHAWLVAHALRRTAESTSYVQTSMPFG